MMRCLGGSLTAAALIWLLHAPASNAQAMDFEGQTYSAVGDAISATRNTQKPPYWDEWRKEKMRQVLVEGGSRVGGEVVTRGVASKGPRGSELLTDAVVSDPVTGAFRDILNYATTRPDRRPRMEQLMDKAGMEFGDLDLDVQTGPDYQLRLDKALLERIDQTLMLQKNAIGDSHVRDEWLRKELARIDSDLADMQKKRDALNRPASQPATEPAPPVASGPVDPPPLGPKKNTVTVPDMLPTSASAPAGAWTTRSNTVTRGQNAQYCGRSDNNRPFCFEIGCVENGTTYISLAPGEFLIRPGSSWVVNIAVDRTVYGPITLSSLNGGTNLVTLLDEQGSQTLSGALKRGRRAAIQLDQSFGNEVMPMSLRGSSRAISAAEASCPAGGDADPGTCLSNESELFSYFMDVSGGGMAFANNSVVAVSNAPTTEPLGPTGPDGEYQFRISDIELCNELTARR